MAAPGARDARETAAQFDEPRAVQLDRSRDVGRIVERSLRGGQRQRIDIERLAHAIEQVRDIGMRQRIADPQAGESVGLRKGPGHDQVREIPDRPAGIGTVDVARILEVRLVDHRDHPGGSASRKPRSSRAPSQVPTGLLGFAMNTRRVAGPMSARKESRS